VRKSLVGDVTFLHKAFLFLENWGLINYGAPSAADVEKEEEEEEPCKVRLEEGTPNGIRVVATPNSLKPILVPRGAKTGGNATAASLKLPPLASYSDIYGDLIRQKEGNCGLCGGKCGSGHYLCTQVITLKKKCFLIFVCIKVLLLVIDCVVLWLYFLFISE